MKKIIPIICLIIIASCSKDNQIEKFANTFKQKIKLKSISLTHNNNLLGDPTDIKIIDSTLLFLDPDDQYHIKAVNINNLNKSYHFLIKGRGPNEFGSIRSINVINQNEVCFLDDNTQTYYEIPFKFTDKPVDPSFKKKLLIDFGRVIFTAGIKHTNISSGVYKNEGRFLLSNESEGGGNTLIGHYPTDNFPESTTIVKGMAYQTFLRSGKDDNQLIGYCFRAGCITFFDFDNNGCYIKKEHTFYTPKYSLNTDHGLGVIYNKESLVCFLDVCIVNNYVFALFSGRSVKDYRTSAYLGNRIFVFSKEGDPKAEISLDADIRCFDIDVQNSTIYGVTLTPFPKIIKFILKETLNLNK
jgi:hypothetical protein